jgi:hypothetical protein
MCIKNIILWKSLEIYENLFKHYWNKIPIAAIEIDVCARTCL